MQNKDGAMLTSYKTTSKLKCVFLFRNQPMKKKFTSPHHFIILKKQTPVRL